MRLLVALSVLAVLGGSWPATARDYGSFGDEYYRSSDGTLVHRPTRQANPEFGPVTADCRDGTHSYSHHHRGTCSGHGGVAEWRPTEPGKMPAQGLPNVIVPSGAR
jgi:hypothetical protein